MVEWSFAIFHKPLNARSEINRFSRAVFSLLQHLISADDLLQRPPR